MRRGLALGLALALGLSLPATARAHCSTAKGQPLRTDSKLTLDYLICKHAEQAQAQTRLRLKTAPPQDKTQIPDGAIDRLGRRTDPFGARARAAQQGVDAMGDVNKDMADRLLLLKPRRIP